jgi:Zn-dependent protease with chaperone function
MDTESESTKSLQSVLQDGLEALKQKDYSTAIAQLESVRQAATEPAMIVKAQMGLIRAYARTGEVQLASALCKPLCQSSNPQIQTWATQTLTDLTSATDPPTPPSAPPPDETGFTPIAPTADATGFTPLGSTPLSSAREVIPPTAGRSFRSAARSTPAIPPDANPIIDSHAPTEVLPLDSSESIPDRSTSEDFDLASVDTTDITDATDITDTPNRTAIDPLAPTELPEPATPPVEDTDRTAIGLPAAEMTALLPSPIAQWRQAGRAQKWTSLGDVDASPLWALAAGTAVVLFLLIRTGWQISQAFLNSTLFSLSWPINLHIYRSYKTPSWQIAIGLVVLFCITPWLLDTILKRVYRLQPLSLVRLESHSLETIRLLKRTSNQRRYPIPKFSILPDKAPLIFTYGYLPRHARIVVSQGLLAQLDDEELAAIVAGELGHIAYWDFGILSLITLLMQLPYLVYWHIAAWGDRQHDRVLKGTAAFLSALGYGLYWLLRLPGLWLSRVRLYYSDRMATELTGNPNALTRALLKLSVGIADEIQRQGYTAPLLESFELLLPIGSRGALCLGSLYNPPATALLEWDRSNPYRRWLAINNAHPPLGDRLHLLMLYARHWRLLPELDWQAISPDAAELRSLKGAQPLPTAMPRRSSAFSARRLLLQGAPFFGLLIGGAIATILLIIGWLASQNRWLTVDWLWDDRLSILIGGMLVGFSFGMFQRINPSFPDIKRSNLLLEPSLPTLLTDPTPLPIDSQPIRIRGILLGRRGISNRLMPDLILKTQTGTIRLHHMSRFGPVGNLLSQTLRPIALMDTPVIVTGWFRRGATPWIEVETLQAQRGGTTIRSEHPIWSTLLACLTTLLGVLIIFTGAV